MPHGSITSLVYLSTARPGLDHDDFLAIMRVARRNNQHLGITGLMLSNRFNFIQFIEGNRTAANDCLHCVAPDNRHSGMTILTHLEMVDRQFARWHMAGRFLPMKPDMVQANLTQLLSDHAVTDEKRAFFQSFRSLGAKTSG